MMLPNFLYIGAGKAGSTWLSECLRNHPDVFMATVKELNFPRDDDNEHLMKEINFFNKQFEKGLAWYESHFSDWSGQTAIGEASPRYFDNPSVPGRIRATLGNVKLIASLRHPVDRAYSKYWYLFGRGNVDTFDSNFLDLFRSGKRFRNTGYYFTHLGRYLDYFPREDLLILIHEEDIAANPQKGIAKCFEFLGVDSGFVPDKLKVRVNVTGNIRMLHEQSWAFRRAYRRLLLPEGLRKSLSTAGRFALQLLPKKQSGYKPLAEDFRQELLNDYYMSDIRQLEELLDRDLSIWYDSPGSQSEKSVQLT